MGSVGGGFFVVFLCVCGNFESKMKPNATDLAATLKRSLTQFYGGRAGKRKVNRNETMKSIQFALVLLFFSVFFC